ncbi:hypothetical protein NMY22_g7984 [Coprinellus aureogranulatus]|nr:hypothetical protein NMY22_g7984 [Coprinellus aureogranulatus]
MAVQSRIVRQRSPTFYYDDGNLVLMAVDEEEGTAVVYRVYRSLLCDRSEMLRDMFSLPKILPSATVLEGMDDDHPIPLNYPKFTPRKVNHFMAYLFSGPSQFPRTDQFLFDVLELSHYFMMDDGIEYAVTRFDARRCLSPPLRIRLGREYGITKWVEPAARQLLDDSLASITAKDAEDMGFQVFFLISSTKARIDELRKAMAFTPPGVVKDPQCPSLGRCEDEWKEKGAMQWWAALGPHLLRPDVATVGASLMANVEQLAFSGVCEACQTRTISWMKERKMFDLDTKLVEECIIKINVFCGA